MKAVSLTLILRSWWRNKAFAIISIVSLAIGIACTNLLAAFVIYEFNIEADNPNKEQIVYMAQDSPMQSGETVSYVVGSIPLQLKEQYTEVVDYLRFGAIPCSSLEIDNRLHAPVIIASTDTTFPHFFPYNVIAGNLHEALSQPCKAALTAACARKLFGTANPIGKTFAINRSDAGVMMEDETPTEAPLFQVAAVIEEYPQSFLTFDMLVGNDNSFYGGTTLLKVSDRFDSRLFAEKLKKDQVPTLQNEKGSYHFYPLQAAYFQKYTQETIPYINRGQRSLLYVGQVSALLILLIACFNYVNLSFSRILQQVRMIHTQKLMGATPAEINRQLFTDTFLTVVAAFLLSLLIAHDLLPVFNRIISGRLSSGFFLSGQVLPFIGALILVLSIIPAVYMSRKVSGLTDSGYRAFAGGNQKRRIVTALSIVQYVISIGLIMATLTVNEQLKLVQKSGERFRNLIEVGTAMGNSQAIYPLSHELEKHPFITGMTLAGGSIQSAWLRQIIIQHPDGSESFYSGTQYMGETNLLNTLQIEVVEGMQPEEAIRQHEQPIYINRQYADILVPKGENPVGQLIGKYDESFRPKEMNYSEGQEVICGITENFYIGSIEQAPYPTIIYLNNIKKELSSCLYIRLDETKRAESLAAVQAAWKKINPGEYFTYTDLYASFLQLNKRTTEMADLLFMYAIISLFLTCFGLFGMALYATQQRTKEIGIRKVNGAGTCQIMLLLNRQFVGWIAIAFILAAPLTWFWLNQWLEGFVYRVDISFGHFLLAGLLVLAVTLLTVSWHSYRAASGNPVESLKAE